MDKNTMNCPKCGHSVNDTTKPCAYCGAVISSGESSSQPDEKIPATAAQSSVPPPEDASPTIELTDESAGVPEASKAKSAMSPQATFSRKIPNRKKMNPSPKQRRQQKICLRMPMIRWTFNFPMRNS